MTERILLETRDAVNAILLILFEKDPEIKERFYIVKKEQELSRLGMNKGGTDEEYSTCKQELEWLKCVAGEKVDEFLESVK